MRYTFVFGLNFYSELGKLIRGDSSVDKVGALVYLVAVSLIFVGLGWNPFGVYLNFDPGYFFFDHIFYHMSSQTMTTRCFCFSSRLFLTTWSVLEATRSWALVQILHSAFVDVLTKILHSI